MADDYVKRSDVHKVFQPKYAPAINRTFAAMIDSVPAADVVEVVRCGECKYWEHRPDRRYDLCAYLIGAKFSRTPEDFCSRGERKGGQDDV